MFQIEELLKTIKSEEINSCQQSLKKVKQQYQEDDTGDEVSGYRSRPNPRPLRMVAFDQN